MSTTGFSQKWLPETSRYHVIYRYSLPLNYLVWIPILFSLLSLVHCNSHEGELIKIKPGNLINESGYGNAMALFDEPDTALTPVSSWKTPGQVDFWPAGVVIDLEEEYMLTGVWYFDGPVTAYNGTEYERKSGQLELNTGIPFEWKMHRSLQMVNDSAWHFVHLNVRTRFFQLKKISTADYSWHNQGPYRCDLNLGEVLFEGYPLHKRKKSGETILNKQDVVDSDTSANHVDFSKKFPDGPRLPVECFAGVNSFAWEDQRLLDQFDFIREYHHWKINGVINESEPISWHPGPIDFDSFYRKNAGKVIVDVHRHVQESQYGESRPDFGEDPGKPESYRLISDYVFQLALRYGNSTTHRLLARNVRDEPETCGAGWVSGIEVWNEPDRWWGKEGDHFTPYQLAAMASATFDGHMGAMGQGMGIKTADTSMLVILAGLGTLDTSYIKAIKFWCDNYRKGSFPADVISFHHYCNTSGGQGFIGGSKGVSPEADDFKGRMQRLVEWRNRNLPDCQVWITEFGWDALPGTAQSAAGHKLFPVKYTAEDLQADWLVRSYLAGAAAGIDRMSMFMLRDEPGEGLFKSCGLVAVDGKPKKSWFYLTAFLNTLRGTTFIREVPSEQPDTWIYNFSNKDQSREVYVLWCPTSDGTTVKNYMFSIPGTNCIARMVQLADDLPEGKITLLQNIHNMVRIDVSETPVMIIVER
ncbi:MAG: hypothetical protein U0T82_11335 [Bacteroidales bacterium]